METQTHDANRLDVKAGRNKVLGIYVILSTFFISAYALVQYFTL